MTTALFWIFEPSYPIKLVATMADAVQFLADAANEGDIVLSLAAKDFLMGDSPRATV